MPVVPDFYQARSRATISIDSFHSEAHKAAFPPGSHWVLGVFLSVFPKATLGTQPLWGAVQLSRTEPRCSAFLSFPSGTFPPSSDSGRPEHRPAAPCSFGKIYHTFTASAPGARPGVRSRSTLSQPSPLQHRWEQHTNPEDWSAVNDPLLLSLALP